MKSISKRIMVLFFFIFVILAVLHFNTNIANALSPGMSVKCCWQLLNDGEMTMDSCDEFKDLTIKDCEEIEESFSRADAQWTLMNTPGGYNFLVPLVIFVLILVIITAIILKKRKRRSSNIQP